MGYFHRLRKLALPNQLRYDTALRIQGTESEDREQGRNLLGNMKTTGERKGRDRNKGGTSYSVPEDEKTEEGKIRKWLK